jgi:hypothetical protein
MNDDYKAGGREMTQPNQASHTTIPQTNQTNNLASHVEEHSMLTGVESKALEESAKLLINGIAPKLLDYGKMLWSGKTFLVLGPRRSGKTNFMNYLEYLILEPEKPTPVTVEIERRRDRILKLGPDQALTLRARRPRDVPGQDPIFQIKHIEKIAPHCVVLVLDASKLYGNDTSIPPMEKPLEWLRVFCKPLNTVLVTNSKVTRKLKSLTIVMNKWDKMLAAANNEKDESDARMICEADIRDILDSTLSNPFYSKEGGSKQVDILACSLVSGTPYQDALAKQLIQSIALSLAKE